MQIIPSIVGHHRLKIISRVQFVPSFPPSTIRSKCVPCVSEVQSEGKTQAKNTKKKTFFFCHVPKHNTDSALLLFAAFEKSNNLEWQEL